jgi:hypothetical protein
MEIDSKPLITSFALLLLRIEAQITQGEWYVLSPKGQTIIDQNYTYNDRKYIIILGLLIVSNSFYKPLVQYLNGYRYGWSNVML